MSFRYANGGGYEMSFRAVLRWWIAFM